MDVDKAIDVDVCKWCSLCLCVGGMYAQKMALRTTMAHLTSKKKKASCVSHKDLCISFPFEKEKKRKEKKRKEKEETNLSFFLSFFLD